MKLPEYEWVQFRQSPLRLVLGQVRFTIMPRLDNKAFIADFQDALHPQYPRVSREASITYQLSLTGISPDKGEMLWRYSSRDNQWSVILGESAITLESRGYTSMTDFLNRFRMILEVAQEKLGITDRLRLGLRYINEIRYPEANNFTEWQSLLNPAFAGFDASDLLDGNVDNTLQQIQVIRPDGNFSIRHGLLNGTVVTPQPQENMSGGQFYLIDLDYYDSTLLDELSISETVQQMQVYNDIMYRFFRWTLGEKLYNYLEPEHD